MQDTIETMRTVGGQCCGPVDSSSYAINRDLVEDVGWEKHPKGAPQQALSQQSLLLGWQPVVGRQAQKMLDTYGQKALCVATRTLPLKLCKTLLYELATHLFFRRHSKQLPQGPSRHDMS